MSDSPFGINGIGEVLSDSNGAFGVAQWQFAQSYDFCGDIKFRHSSVAALRVIVVL